MITRTMIVAMTAAGLAACASTPLAGPDYRAALLRPCANTADWAPWLLVDAWDDGDVYRPATQFREDGVMVYAYEGTTYDNGKWSLDGNQLHFDTNDHYADYDGVFDGESGRGRMKNTEGDTGKWTLARACDR
jgi:chitodextrinase